VKAMGRYWGAVRKKKKKKEKSENHQNGIFLG